MKYLLIILSFVAVLCAPVALATHASAVDLFENTCNDSSTKISQKASVCKDVQSQTGSTDNPIIHIIKIAINVVSFIVGAAAVIGLIVGGIRLVISNGDANSAATARSSILYSLIGLAVVVFAQGIVVFVLNRVQ